MNILSITNGTVRERSEYFVPYPADKRPYPSTKQETEAANRREESIA